MKKSELKNKLLRLNKLKNIISTKVKAIYQEHNDLTIECTEEILKKEGGKLADPILKTSVLIKFKDGNAWELVPNYMKDGNLNNVIWKQHGIHAFEIKHLPF